MVILGGLVDNYLTEFVRKERLLGGEEANSSTDLNASALDELN